MGIARSQIRMPPLPIETGKLLRFPELFDHCSPLIVAPVDDTLISGPVNGLEETADKIESILSDPRVIFLGFRGAIARHAQSLAGRTVIMNLSASTTCSGFTQKCLVSSVEDALRIGASAVAVHINVSSKYAPSMLRDAGEVVAEAARYSMPVVGIMYPRGEDVKGEVEEFDRLRVEEPKKFADLIAHCTRIGVELGCDLIKTQFLVEPAGYQRMLDAASGIPVVIAGGPLIDQELALRRASAAIASGIRGISFARNVFGRDDPLAFYTALRERIASEI